MSKHDHDELIARARALRADSPGADIVRARLDLLDEATSLQRAVASQLRG